MSNERKDDWFNQLDAELEQSTQNIEKDVAELKGQKATVNRALIEDFAKIKTRFDKLRVFLTMEPPQSVYADPTSTQEQWNIKPDFDFSAINNIQLIDRTQVQGRMGDSLKVWYYPDEKGLRVRIVFEYCEGEHYYKYAGWKRVFGQFVIYDASLAEVDLNPLHEQLAKVVKAWYESYLKQNREVLIDSLKQNFQKGETFTE